MSEPKHTPSPWIAIKGMDEDDERWGVYVDSRLHYHIATIENGAPGDTLETEGRNARLIAAAPELLAALERIEMEALLTADPTAHLQIIFDVAHAALAKVSP